MIIKSRGYDLNFIQKVPSSDESAHLYTLIFKFYSPITNYHYVVRAEYHRGDFFAIKFYVKKHRKSDYKYSKITNKGDLVNILVTNAKVVPILLEAYPNASFGFSGARTLDYKSMKVENYEQNQRFRIYRNIVSILFGDQTFVHYEYPSISGYLLINKRIVNVDQKEEELIKMLSETYENLPDLG